MSAAAVVPFRQVPRLTPEQRALVQSVPGIAEIAARDVLATCGNVMPVKVAVREAHWGIVRAAASYVETPSVPFRRWAFYRACEAILDAGRADARHGKLCARLRSEVLQYFGQEPEIPETALVNETAEQLLERLHALLDGAVGAAACGGVAQAEKALGAEYVEEREAWRVTMAALGQVVRGLTPEQRRMLAACYVEAENKKEAADLLGMKYDTLLRHHQDLVKLIGARLRALGVREIPWNIDRELPSVLAGATAEDEET